VLLAKLGDRPLFIGEGAAARLAVLQFLLVFHSGGFSSPDGTVSSLDYAYVLALIEWPTKVQAEGRS